jgi:hypothetical protein
MNESELSDLSGILETSYGLQVSEIIKFYPKLIEPIGKPSQLDFTPREFFYWLEKGVIDIPKTDTATTQWNRLNLIEVVWIRLVKELRFFNIPFEFISKLNSLLLVNGTNGANEFLNVLVNEAKQKFSDPNLKTFLDLLLETIKQNFERNDRGFKQLFSVFGLIVADILFSKSEISIIFFKHDNDSMDFVIEGIKNNPYNESAIENAKKGAYLHVSINTILRQYVDDPKFESLNEDFGIIREEEKEILRQIRDKNVKEINIKRDGQETITITSTQASEIKNEKVRELKSMLRMNDFDEVRVVLRNNKHMYLENKKIIKIRPAETAQKQTKIKTR